MKISKFTILNVLFVLSIALIISLLLVTHHANTYGTQATEFKHSPTHHVDTVLFSIRGSYFSQKIDLTCISDDTEVAISERSMAALELPSYLFEGDTNFALSFSSQKDTVTVGLSQNSLRIVHGKITGNAFRDDMISLYNAVHPMCQDAILTAKTW